MKSTNNIRQLFLNFFKSQLHTIVPSSSLVPYNDPTLMFTNSGMVQFKNIFTGEEKSSFKRASSSQKCVRAGGKHNDLDNVGYTARHHTFFEMLGNFSFGDYFKEEAILFAWNFLTKELNIAKEKLYITIYYEDDEAYEIWHKITGFSKNRIIRITTNDNFWSMGDLGPCGPCSEIFYDHGDHIAGGLPGQANSDGDRYVEIWNLVFMQYEQLANGERIKLPKPCIDTGMGLERIAAVMQNVHDNYDIDLFKNIISASEEFSSVPSDREHAVSHRIIADHMRSTCFLLADGVSPSNEGRGYVLRRIMRRAMRHAHQLGCQEPLLYKLVPAINKEMGKSYPELIRAENFITATLKQEEERFLLTLDKGLKLLDIETKSLKTGDTLSGNIVFKLYDTYGFPFDLTKDILKSQNLLLNEEEFEQAMQKQRELARNAWTGSGEQVVSSLWFDLYNQFGATEFLGYDGTQSQAKILAIIANDHITGNFTIINGKIAIILNQTPFYAESGGQMGDIGEITNNKGLKLIVNDTKKYLGKLHVHIATLLSGTLNVGDVVNATINVSYRNKLRANHSVTHLLHATLQTVLGSHITQKGSLVASDKLRFDFSHNKPLTKDEIILIEQIINDVIRQNTIVSTNQLPITDAIKGGAMALFGEKYEDEVRVVTIAKSENAFSKELCGGTHVQRTGDIGLFKIVNESAIASGIRRIEAVTGEAAIKLIHAEENTLYNLASLLSVSVDELYNRVTNLVEEKKGLEKALLNMRKGTIVNALENSEREQIGDFILITHVVNDMPAKELRNLIEKLQPTLKNTILAVISITEAKLSVVIGVSKEITSQINAIELAQISAQILGGTGGGGKAELAQSGGIFIDKIPDVIAAIKDKLRNNN